MSNNRISLQDNSEKMSDSNEAKPQEQEEEQPQEQQEQSKGEGEYPSTTSQQHLTLNRRRLVLQARGFWQHCR